MQPHVVTKAEIREFCFGRFYFFANFSRFVFFFFLADPRLDGGPADRLDVSAAVRKCTFGVRERRNVGGVWMTEGETNRKVAKFCKRPRSIDRCRCDLFLENEKKFF